MSLFSGRRRDQELLLEDEENTSVNAPLASRPAQTQAAPRLGSGERTAKIGKSIAIRGDLTGEEDIVIEGQVDGKVEFPKSEVTVGKEGRVRAEIRAKAVVVVGHVVGNVNATERIELRGSGIVEGDVRAPRLVVQEGAVLNGQIEMTSGKTASRPQASKPSNEAPQPVALGATARNP